MKPACKTLTPYVCPLALLAALAISPAPAQMTPLASSSSSVRGVVRGASQPGVGYIVELRGNSSGFPAETFVDPSGSFQLSGVAPGQYVLMVKTQQGTVVHQEFVTVGAGSGELWIQLPERKPERPVSGTVSVKRLAHKVPGKAAKEFARAEKAFEKGDLPLSVQHLEKAIEIDPEYMEAHNNLASRYMQMQNYEKALAHIRQACELDPGASLPQSNLATALLLTKQFGAAETAARRAIDLDPSSSRSRFALSVALLEQGKNVDEAMEHLQRAATDFPRAHLMMAKVHAAQGRVENAREELQRYLELSGLEPAEKQEVETWLASLAAPAGQSTMAGGK